MKLNLSRILEEIPGLDPSQDQQEKKEDPTKYQLKSVGGGFSDGIKINKDPENVSFLSISVSLYGGGEVPFLKFPVPKHIRSLYSKYDHYISSGISVPAEIESRINEYHSRVNSEISKKIVALLKSFDKKAYNIIKSTINDINSSI